MRKKLAGKALKTFEARRDVWREVLDAAREIKAGGGKRTKVQVMETFKQDLLKSVKQMQRGKAVRVTRARGS